MCPWWLEAILTLPFSPPAGYNNLEVAEYLLEHGADVNAQDKGGLIPLHNASSYGHLDIAALLIKHNTVVNATDKWGYTPLHEAAQKGRTQLCSLLVSITIATVAMIGSETIT